MKTNDENILYQLKTVEKFLLEINEKLKLIGGFIIQAQT